MDPVSNGNPERSPVREKRLWGDSRRGAPPLLVNMSLCSREAWESSDVVSESSKESGRSMNRKGKDVFVGDSGVSRTGQ